jgi:tRNA A37 threonylcarbamoyladenosine modification protein TsaB
MASQALGPGTIVAAWMDAHRGDVFSARYQVTDAPPFAPERLAELEGAAVADPAATLSRWRGHGMPEVVIGDGAMAYRGLLEGMVQVMAPPPLAAAIGRMAVARAAIGATIDPAAVQPLYVRRPDAEAERDRKNVNHQE